MARKRGCDMGRAAASPAAQLAGVIKTPVAAPTLAEWGHRQEPSGGQFATAQVDLQLAGVLGEPTRAE